MHPFVNPQHHFRDKNFLKTFIINAKRYLRDRESRKNGKMDYDHVLQNFQVFVSVCLDRYRVDYQKEPEFQQEFYNRFWKTFFDELLVEARRLFDYYNEEMKDVSEFTRDLQKIAEKGLSDFSKFFKPGIEI